MSAYKSFLPHVDAATRTSTAQNATVATASNSFEVKGPIIVVSIGAAAGAYIRFGKLNVTVTTSNGLLLPASFIGSFSLPADVTHIAFIRPASTDSTISVLGGQEG